MYPCQKVITISFKTAVTVGALIAGMATGAAAQVPGACPAPQPVPGVLRIPDRLPPGEPKDFEKALLAYFTAKDSAGAYAYPYRKLGWCEDKSIRDTGPFINNQYFGTHLAVRIYYSPEVIDWLKGGRQGAIPDGAVIIKEQHKPPAERAITMNGPAEDWVFMIKKASASKDGWFWGEVYEGMTFDDFQYPNAGFGLYCLRCHASAEKESTFSALNNIKGLPGEALQFRVDDSWRPPPPKGLGSQALALALQKVRPAPQDSEHERNLLLSLEKGLTATHALPDFSKIQVFPPEPLDTVLSGPSGPPLFLTSSQCLPCHGGLAGPPFGPTMVALPPGATGATGQTGRNVSPYGEWRWSPMGLAGRDPVFYSQLDSELAFPPLEPPQRQLIVDTCENCHGAMGKKSYAIDHPKEDFKVDFVYETNPANPGFQYGSLAREGISCLVCHHTAPPKDPSLAGFLKNNINGNIELTKPDELYGPFKDNEITTYQMDQSLGIKPKHNDYIQSSQLCGSCHTIVLPVLDAKPGLNEVEQATYPEWLNSDFRNEYGSKGAKAESCQECHMPGGYRNLAAGIDLPVLQTRIAAVQDATYPAAEQITTPENLNVRRRAEGYRRHEFLGSNGFLLELARQSLDAQSNNPIFGLRTKDYMTGLTTDLQEAINNLVQQARQRTATIQFSGLQITSNSVKADVVVTNLTGHRFPSGVGFRRLFVQFTVKSGNQVIWQSGQTNQNGEILGANGRPLLTEYFAGGKYQPHFSAKNPIESQDQVQIFEELVEDAKGQITTSFTRRDEELKDNRLLPQGWRKTGPPDLKIPDFFLAATLPKGGAIDDPNFTDGKGRAVVSYRIAFPDGLPKAAITVSAALYYQAQPPYYLADRYKTPTPATARLKYLFDVAGDFKGTRFTDRKLLVSGVTLTRPQ